MITNMKKLTSRLQKIHYAWIILICCCMINGACLGTIINCKGIYISPVVREMGWTSTKFTLYITFYGLCSAITLSFVPKVFLRYRFKIVLFISLIALCLSTALMGSFQSVFQWYIAGAVQGISGAFILFVPTTYLINQWFSEKKGLALGIASSFSGIMGSLMNPFLTRIIISFGWRKAYFIQGVIAFILAAPFILLIVKTPEEKGLSAYGASPVATDKSSEKKTADISFIPKHKTILISLCLCLAFLTSFSTAFTQHLSNYSVSIGFVQTVGAGWVSCAMAGNVIIKMVLGSVRDKIGIHKTWYGSLFFSSAAFIILILAKRNILISSLGAFLLGFINANLTVLIPLNISERFPRDSFQTIYSKVTIGNMLAGAFSTSGISMIYDMMGSYTGSFIAGIIIQICCMILVYLYFNLFRYSGK